MLFRKKSSIKIKENTPNSSCPKPLVFALFEWYSSTNEHMFYLRGAVMIRITEEQAAIIVKMYEKRFADIINRECQWSKNEVALLNKFDETIQHLKTYLQKPNRIQVYTDGSCRGQDKLHESDSDPKASCGYIIKAGKKVIYAKSKFLGQTVRLTNKRILVTSTIAEYFAVLHALQWLVDNGYDHASVDLYTDSMVVVRQVDGDSRTLAPHLLYLRNNIRKLIQQLHQVNLHYAPSSQTISAHNQANKAYYRKHLKWES